ncbi:MAG: dephospho-CoA kinase [Chromatiales bacterium]
MPFAVGLTGGIGSGKSTVCELFSALGVPVLDADRVARDLVERGSPALEHIEREFGHGVLAPDGNLDRAALRKMVFQDAAKRAALEAILHPRIKETIGTAMAQLDTPYCIVCVPLLLESGWADLVQRIAVVDAPEDLQRKRAIARDGLTSAEVEAIMQVQMPRAGRLARADDVLSNDGDLEHLRRQVHMLHRKYLELVRRTEPAAECR